MRLFFGTKCTEFYLILTGIFLLYSFDKLCEKNEADMNQARYYVQLVSPPAIANFSGADSYVRVRDDRRPTVAAIDAVTQKPATPVVVLTKADELPANVSLVPHPAEHLVPHHAEPDLVKLETDEPDVIADLLIKNQSHVQLVSPPPMVNVSGADPNVLVEENRRPTAAVIDAVTQPPTAPVMVLTKAEELRSNVSGVPLPTDPEAQPLVTEKPTILAAVWGFFGGSNENVRVKRDADEPAFNTDRLVKNQSYVGVYRCEKASPFFSKAAADPYGPSIYQQLFAFRYVGIILLFVHLLLVLYHTLVNVMHRIPTSQRFNRIFAVLGLIIWNIITLWIILQLITWGSKFDGEAVSPSIPSQFFAFLVIAFAMNVLLLYELISPKTFFLSYDITPRHPRRGYVPAAQSENEYINGIIRQLETPPPTSFESRPVIRAFDVNA